MREENERQPHCGLHCGVWFITPRISFGMSVLHAHRHPQKNLSGSAVPWIALMPLLIFVQQADGTEQGSNDHSRHRLTLTSSRINKNGD